MICLCMGADVDWFFRRLESDLHLYTQVVVCSPYIDRRLRERVLKLAGELDKIGCGFELITAPAAASTLDGLVPRARQTGWRRLVSSRYLHAKVYIAIAREPKHSLLVITSANATTAALERNIELGLLVKGDTMESAQLINQAKSTLQELAAIQKRGKTWRRL